MRTFQPNDRVVCVDATPIPIGAPDTDFLDFDFPDGYIQDGTVYYVKRVVLDAFGAPALFLVGPRAVINGRTIPWNGQRFRKLRHTKLTKHQHHSQHNRPDHDIPF